MSGITSMQLAAAVLLGAVWLPYPNNLSWPIGNSTIGGAVFPLNDPAWSLFFEAFVNTVFFFYVYRFRKLASLSFFCISAAIFILVTIVWKQINPGWGTYNFVFAFPRVVAEFFAGVLIYQYGFHRKVPRPRLAIFASSVLLLSLFGGWKAALLSSLTLIPLIIVLASAVKIESTFWKQVCRVLGNISYPLYIIHFPMYRILWNMSFVRTSGPIMQTVIVSFLCISFALILAVLDKNFRQTLMLRNITMRRQRV